MLSFMVELHGAQGARCEAAAGGVAVKSWFTAVGIKVFAQINQVFTSWQKQNKKKRRALVNWGR